MISYNRHAGSSKNAMSSPPTVTEFEILKSSHRFLREENEKDDQLSWGDKIAKKYYSTLFREFAVCDLKHYKSGNFALRWRTENEVLSGAGEETCGNTRCVHHEPSKVIPMPPLKTVELPFSYEEDNQWRSALVKVVLCDRCVKKLMWKRNKEKGANSDMKTETLTTGSQVQRTEREAERWNDDTKRKTEEELSKESVSSNVYGRRRRHSRSPSPRRKKLKE